MLYKLSKHKRKKKFNGKQLLKSKKKRLNSKPDYLQKKKKLIARHLRIVNKEYYKKIKNVRLELRTMPNIGVRANFNGELVTDVLQNVSTDLNLPLVDIEQMYNIRTETLSTNPECLPKLGKITTSAPKPYFVNPLIYVRNINNSIKALPPKMSSESDKIYKKRTKGKSRFYHLTMIFCSYIGLMETANRITKGNVDISKRPAYCKQI